MTDSGVSGTAKDVRQADGREETLSEYMCDWPDCPNIAVEVVTFVRELRTCTVMCTEHAAQTAKQARAKNDTPS